MKSCRWRKRALSTVVTGVIILSAVAIMGSMVVVWSQTVFSEHQAALEVSFASNTNKLNEGLLIENVWFALPSPPSMPQKHLNVTLSNIGTIHLNITEIDLVDPNGTNLIPSVLISDGGLAINSIYSANVTYADWTVDKALNVVVTTERGKITTTQVIP